FAAPGGADDANQGAAEDLIDESLGRGLAPEVQFCVALAKREQSPIRAGRPRRGLARDGGDDPREDAPVLGRIERELEKGDDLYGGEALEQVQRPLVIHPYQG